MIRIEILYSETANLYGDNFCINYIKQSLDEVEIIQTALTETPRFVNEAVDLVYMGPMPESSQELVIEALRPHMEALRRRIDEGKVFLMTGNAFEVFGLYIENEDGTRIPGLELFGGYAKRRMMDRFNGMFLGSLEDLDGKELKILGFKSQFTHFYGDTGVDYAFKRLRGKGLNPDAEGEGVRIKNFIGTYLIGPLLVVNPLFTVYILQLCGIKDPHPAFEEEAMEAYNIRLKEFEDPTKSY
ncbi:MAG: hypothetical protein K6A77_02995 [Clostridiales bacterium]|nr:hypothetical protein [Clostridiales bacterium]